ncbi:MAG: class I SAM-dependent methyltransferase [Thermoguttaceae bacterium]
MNAYLNLDNMHRTNYALLDFGTGRKLEQFGPVILDRPAPAAKGRIAAPHLWKLADAKFIEKSEKGHQNDDCRGDWIPQTERGFNYFPKTVEIAPSEKSFWAIAFDNFVLDLKGTPFGHLGIFPEQQNNWRRITKLLNMIGDKTDRPIRVLNLFAYTGGSTMAAACTSANIEVTHLDASKSVVEWAKRNAAANQIGVGPHRGRIRWIIEDALQFVKREKRRQNKYDAVILDPPSYGHGHGHDGKRWEFGKHLPILLSELAHLWSDRPIFSLLTAHTPLFYAKNLHDLTREAGWPRLAKITEETLFLTDETGRSLESGQCVWGESTSFPD